MRCVEFLAMLALRVRAHTHTNDQHPCFARGGQAGSLVGARGDILMPSHVLSIDQEEELRPVSNFDLDPKLIMEISGRCVHQVSLPCCRLSFACCPYVCACCNCGVAVLLVALWRGDCIVFCARSVPQ